MEENEITLEDDFCYICHGTDEYCPNCGSRIADEYTEK